MPLYFVLCFTMLFCHRVSFLTLVLCPNVLSHLAPLLHALMFRHTLLLCLVPYCFDSPFYFASHLPILLHFILHPCISLPTLLFPETLLLCFTLLLHLTLVFHPTMLLPPNTIISPHLATSHF
jgi:hypothetical protein